MFYTEEEITDKQNLKWGRESSSFQKFITYSFIAHFAFLMSFLLKANFFPSDDIQVPASIRVDMVGLPDKVQPKKVAPKAKPAKSEPQKTKPTPKKTQKKKPQPKKVSLKNNSKKQKQALQKLKALSALERIQKEVEEENRKPQEPQPIKGNQVLDGSSLKGLDKIQFDAFFEELQVHIQTHWNLPQWLAEADFKAQALVVLNDQGYVTKKEILISSGNSVFDDYVMGTIEKAAPYPEPPSRLKSIITSQGFVLNFPQ